MGRMKEKAIEIAQERGVPLEEIIYKHKENDEQQEYEEFKKEQTQIKKNIMLIKQNEVVLYAELDHGSIVWFDDKDSILVFKNQPDSDYRFEYGMINSGEEALLNIRIMKRKGWNLIEERLDLIIQRLRP